MKLDSTNEFRRMLAEEIFSTINTQQKGNLIEIGCGNGTITRQLSKHTKSILALDLDIETTILNNIKYSTIPLDKINEKFDYALFSLSLHHIKEKYSTLEKTSNLLKKNGQIIIIEPTITKPGEEIYFKKFYRKNYANFMEFEKKYLIGDCNESEAKKETIECINEFCKNSKFEVMSKLHFQSFFEFDDFKDFKKNIIPNNWEGNEEELQKELQKCYHGNKYNMYAKRIGYILKDKKICRIFTEHLQMY